MWNLANDPDGCFDSLTDASKRLDDVLDSIAPHTAPTKELDKALRLIEQAIAILKQI